MSKISLYVFLFVLPCLLVGCYTPESSGSKLMTMTTEAIPTFELKDEGEADIVEQMVNGRYEYRKNLQLLADYYMEAGNNLKYRWAKKELEGFDRPIKYHYIAEGAVAGAELKPKDMIYDADTLYGDARGLEKKARWLIFVNDSQLRLALAKYDQLIREYPTSDKIDDAAYRAAGIYEHFGEYSIAVLYYQRTYQWNPRTTEPATYREAYVLDIHLNHIAEALELYKVSLKDDNLPDYYRNFAEQRIAVFSDKEQDEQ